jgi:glucosamine--fructose-6-phosphate aminotransferase (isomerizing)
MGESFTWQEILSQPQTWQATLATFSAERAALEGFLDRACFEQIVVVGCGSTHYLSQAAAMILSQLGGVPARGLPASELWLFPSVIPTEPTLLVTVSRSGATTETVRALDRFRQVNGGAVLAITCCPESALAKRADFVVGAPAAQETSVAQTRSFTSMLVLIQAVAATLARDERMLRRLSRLPSLLEEIGLRWRGLPRQLGEDAAIRQLFFLGGGPFYGLANEAMLKTKEVSLSCAEAYHPLEFRHGPKSMVNEHTLVVGFVSDTGLAEELEVLKETQGLGAQILALVEASGLISGWQPDHLIELRSGLNEWERGPLLLPPVQRMAYHRAVAKGLDPDRPHNLTAVVELPGHEIA